MLILDDAKSLGRPAERAIDEQVEVIRQDDAGMAEELPSPVLAGESGKKVADIALFTDLHPVAEKSHLAPYSSPSQTPVS